MHKNPLISIVIPVYNGANYMREAIDSALAQIYGNIEIIVVNDGSTDNGETERIAKSYGTTIRYFHKENGGVSSALNFGIKKMKGEWFAWLSHDDIFLPQKSEREAAFISDHPSARVLFTNTAVIDANGRITLSENPRYEGKIHGGIWYYRAWIYACSMLIHRSCFDTIGLLDEKNRTVQDVELTLDLLDKYEFNHMPEILVQRRDHLASGMYQLRDLNSREGTDMLIRMLREKGIQYFFAELRGGDVSDIILAKHFNMLAGYLLVGSPLVADYCYERSIALWPSFGNRARYLRFLGAGIVRAVRKSMLFASRIMKRR